MNTNSYSDKQDVLRTTSENTEEMFLLLDLPIRNLFLVNWTGSSDMSDVETNWLHAMAYVYKRLNANKHKIADSLQRNVLYFLALQTTFKVLCYLAEIVLSDTKRFKDTWYFTSTFLDILLKVRSLFCKSMIYKIQHITRTIG